MARAGIVVAAALALLGLAPGSAAAQRCRPVIDTGPTGFDPATRMACAPRASAARWRASWPRRPA